MHAVHAKLDRMKSVLLLIITAVINGSNARNKFAGPFDFIIKEAVFCEDQGTKELYFNETSLRKLARNRFAITTNWFASIPFDDELSVLVNFSVWGNGGWKPNYLMLEYKKACTDTTIQLPGIFLEMLAAANVTSCPLPAGNYRFENVSANVRITQNALPYNKYKVQFIFLSRDGVRHGCVGLVADVIPKDVKKG